MLLLALDTATPAVTVAVHDGERVVAEAAGSGAMAHGELLAPAIRRAVVDAGATMADLTDVAVGVGPGPFTGLRVGVVTALTLGATLGLRTHGVCTLDVLAAAVASAEPFLVATDARRKEVYWGHYAADGSALTGPEVGFPADVAQRFPGLLVHGRGALVHEAILDRGDGPLDPRAADLASLVVSGRAREQPLEPLYLRRPDAVPLAERR